MSTFGHQDLRKSHNKDASLHCLEKIRQGDALLREEFISANYYFIINIISRSLDKPLISESCPEFTVGLSAFNYSIENYDLASSEGFHIYSEKIIREWISNYFEELNTGSNPVSDEIDRYYLYRKYEDKEEISLFKNRLLEFGITLRDLYFISPGDDEPIKLSLKLANTVTENEALFNKLILDKSLPINDLHNNKFQKKFIEKNKEYIIALCLIKKSNLKILQSYLKNIESGNQLSDDTAGIILEFFKKDAIVMNCNGRFTVIRMKNSSKNMGKQVLLGDKDSKEHSGNIYPKLLIAVGSIAAVAVVAYLSMHFIFSGINKSLPANNLTYGATDGNNIVQPGYIDATESNSIETTNMITKKPKEVKELLITPALKDKPSTNSKTSPNVSHKGKSFNSHTSKPRKGTPGKYVQKATEPTIKAPAAVPVNTETPVINNASRLPGPLSLSVESDHLKVGSSITLTAYMSGGNTGTKLLFFENGENVGQVYPHTDTTEPQAKTIGFVATSAGTYTYKCILYNEYGSSESNSIIVVVEP